MKKAKNIQSFLEELRSIAQLGLHYAKDPFDRARYDKLLKMAAGGYSKVFKLPRGFIIKRLRSEFGHVTPKVGVDAAVFNDRGLILLVKRSDDGRWCLPCGWADENETPQEAVRREVREETGLKVRVKSLIDVVSRMPGEFGQPHTSYHIIYHCDVIGGRLSISSETLEAGYYDHRKIKKWHRDHKKRVVRAYQFWLENIK